MNLTKKQVETLLDGAIVYMDELREEVARLKEEKQAAEQLRQTLNDQLNEALDVADKAVQWRDKAEAEAWRLNGADMLKDAAVAECEALKAETEALRRVEDWARQSLVVTSDAGDSWDAKQKLKAALVDLDTLRGVKPLPPAPWVF